MLYQAKETEANIYQRIASGGEETIAAALNLLNEYGLGQPTDRASLAKSLTEAVAVYGDPAYLKIIHIHPDFNAIVSNVAPALPAHKNDCGCNHSDTGHKCSDTGTGISISENAAKVAEPQTTKFDIQHFAMILLLTIGGISFFSMFIGQTYLHMSRVHHNSK